MIVDVNIMVDIIDVNIMIDILLGCKWFEVCGAYILFGPDFLFAVDSEDFCQRYYFPETLYILATLNRTR